MLINFEKFWDSCGESDATRWGDQPLPANLARASPCVIACIYNNGINDGNLFGDTLLGAAAAAVVCAYAHIVITVSYCIKT